MARVRVTIVHDEVGNIISVARPAENAIVIGGDGQSVFETEVEENTIEELVTGSYRADAAQNSVVDLRSQGQQETSY